MRKTERQDTRTFWKSFTHGTFEQLKKDRESYLETIHQEEIDLANSIMADRELQVGKYPLNKKWWQTCIRFRKMYHGHEHKDVEFLCEHMTQCDSCMQWKHELHPSERSVGKTWQGVDLWKDSEPQTREPSDMEKRLSSMFDDVRT